MAIINLLDNAVKYSPSGSPIDVEVQSLKGEAQSARYAKLLIKDEGPGIPASEASRVFDRFYRLDEARTREAGGAGLGLAIAKWSVEAHGGQILVDSSAERGAGFAIHLPLA
jgi:signal transduction histidine kinase